MRSESPHESAHTHWYFCCSICYEATKCGAEWERGRAANSLCTHTHRETHTHTHRETHRETHPLPLPCLRGARQWDILIFGLLKAALCLIWEADHSYQLTFQCSVFVELEAELPSSRTHADRTRTHTHTHTTHTHTHVCTAILVRTLNGTMRSLAPYPNHPN